MTILLRVGFLSLAAALCGSAQIRVLEPADVVFMYQAPKSVYTNYGATVLAWGGKPTPASLAAADGVKFFGSVGMVTEFARYHDRFPSNYEAGLCRDLEGKPFKVPWLTDHQHKGIPYWWCCTRQPVFRQYVSERVVETLKAGAFGVHIDDHLGTAGGLFLGGCFCDRCVGDFPGYLKRQGLAEKPAAYDYRQELKQWLAANPGRKHYDHPGWDDWKVYQYRGAAAFMLELRELAAKTAGRPVPVSANACLLWGPHLSDYRALDFFSAEIEHDAPAKRPSDAPVAAYRIAEALGRPLAATAGGGDWAFVKANNLPGLVRSWIALGYAAGNSLMAPHRQWCYTPEKGTHWYEGPSELFAPLYRFVRENAGLFNDYENHADLLVVYSQKTFEQDRGHVVGTCEELTKLNISYGLELGGDRMVDLALRPERLAGARRLLVLRPKDFTEPDRQTLAKLKPGSVCATVEEARRGLAPAVYSANLKVRLFPRVRPGSAVVHVLNRDYDAGSDTVRAIPGLRVKLDLAALKVPGAKHARAHAPGRTPLPLVIEDGEVLLPEAGLWTVLEIRAGQ